MIESQVNPLLTPPIGPLVVPALADAAHSNGAADRSEAMANPLHFSLIVPTYNEANNIERLIQILCDLLDQAMPEDYELIIVDDDSPDRTWKLAQEVTVTYPQVQVMRRQEERGLSTAVIRGWQVAQGEILGVIDGDLQHPPETLFQLLGAIDTGADLAAASRHIEGGGVSNWSLTRRFLSRGANCWAW